MRQKGIAPLLIIFIIAVAVVGVGGYLAVSGPGDIPMESPREVSVGESLPSSPLEPSVISPVPTASRLAPTPKAILQNPTPTPLQKQTAPHTPTPSPGDTSERHTDAPRSSNVPLVSTSFRNAPELPSSAERSALPDCAGTVFSSAPVDPDRLMNISPLGNLAPPGHTFPTEHMFFHITAGGATTDTIPLYSPGEIHLTLISFGRGFTQDPVDYTIWFAPCKDIVAYYNHVKELSPELEKIVLASTCAFPGESKETRCNITAMAPVAKGVRIGQVGRLQGNFDMGLIDLRKTHAFANPDRYGTRSLHIQCPLDYFDGSIASRLYALLSRSDKKCGTVAQDIAGTLKGNWFFENARADMGSDWNKYLAFADDSERPGIAVVSVGGTFATAGKWEFSPQTSGYVNRAFADVKPDSAIYCYESQKMPGRIAVRLESAAKLTIEYQQGSCAQGAAFVSPTTYER
ncbi:MAG: hypothetical protein U1A25_02375 [Candidatus Sungbacteria bacterium]|nr:hypothetical protein [Candidatus Sungbacteria bacterium]